MVIFRRFEAKHKILSHFFREGEGGYSHFWAEGGGTPKIAVERKMEQGFHSGVCHAGVPERPENKETRCHMLGTIAEIS